MPGTSSIQRQTGITGRKNCKKKSQTAATVREIQKRVYKNEIKESVSQMYDFVNYDDGRLDDVCEVLEHVVSVLDDLRKLMPSEETIYQEYCDLYTEALIEQGHRLCQDLDTLARQYEEASL